MSMSQAESGVALGVNENELLRIMQVALDTLATQ